MSSHLKLSFRRMGADIDITDLARRWRAPKFQIDIQNTKDGEKFLITGAEIGREDIKILDIEPDEKHLLLMWRERETGTKHKYLCGHDERHWFVAAVPENPKAAVKNITDAMEALKPEAVKDRERQVGVKGKARRDRHNEARKRQGEWFFIPVWNQVSLKNSPILKNEPINRGGGKPHLCENLVRSGGVTVWTCIKFPNGLTEGAYRNLLKRDKNAKTWNWVPRVADAKVYVKGKVSHADHATLFLDGWHEVLMNRENEAPSMRHMRFLD
jgi:hypothetical protein